MNVLLKIRLFFLLSVFFNLANITGLNAAEKIEEAVLGMNVSGTKDLPNVLYIVPWKSNISPVSPPSVSRLVDEIYAPIDPDVFTKQVEFYFELTQPIDNVTQKNVENQ